MPRNTNFAMQWLANFACNEPTELEVKTALMKVAVLAKIVNPKMTGDALEERLFPACVFGAGLGNH